ncbi:hypothetical protein MMC29_006169 [Sticta canariensis]|nr:hypothetical protein [Sticta canariensis]
MKLLDLPPEILQAIAEESVIALGPFKAQRARLVNKFLSGQILRATFTTRVIDSYPSYAFDRMSTSMKARYLETRTLADPRGINEFTTVIQRTVDLLLKELEQQSNELRLKYTHVLCAAAADYLDSTRGTAILDKLKTVSVGNGCADDEVEGFFAAAAHVGNASLLKDLIDKGIEIDAPSQYFGRALRGAAFGGHRDAVSLLLDRGADANASPAPPHLNRRQAVLHSRHSTALQAAALAGHEHIVRLLLEPKYHVSASGEEYERAILYAAQGGRLCLMRFLMNDAKIMQPQQLHQWILLEASRNGHLQIVRMMLDLGSPNNPASTRWPGEESPLRVAAFHNFHEIVQFLLARGADPNWGGGCRTADLATPLYDAVRGGHERVAQMLLDHGADINAGLRSPLNIAVRRGNLDMVRFLLERGAELDTEMTESEVILAAAAYRGHEPMVRLLVNFGASVHESDDEPNRAMLDAIRAGHDHVVKTLVELGASIIDPLQTVYAKDFESGKYPLRKST